MKAKYKAPKIIVRPVEPRLTPATVTIAKIKRFLAENMDKFSDIVYMGWVRREYTVEGESEIEETKRGLRFIAATAKKRLDARNIMKKSNNWGIDVWDLTD